MGKSLRNVSFPCCPFQLGRMFAWGSLNRRTTPETTFTFLFSYPGHLCDSDLHFPVFPTLSFLLSSFSYRLVTRLAEKGVFSQETPGGSAKGPCHLWTVWPQVSHAIAQNITSLIGKRRGLTCWPPRSLHLETRNSSSWIQQVMPFIGVKPRSPINSQKLPRPGSWKSLC